MRAFVPDRELPNRHPRRSGTPLLPDILAPGLDVVFVGAAPSHRAAAIGHYYPGPRNRFWWLLHQSGFTPRQLEPEEDRLVLEYGIGLTAILRDVASGANAALPPPTEEDRRALRASLSAVRPRWVCYNGKDVYRMCEGVADCAWGEQPETIAGARVFVVHSSSGRADAWGADRLLLYRELHALVAAGSGRHVRRDENR